MDAMSDLRHETHEVANLIARLREMCGDDEQAFIDTLEGESDTIEAARRVLRWIHEQGASADMCKGLATTYTARSSVFAERVERGRTSLLHFLNELGLRSMPLPEGTLTVVAGKAKVVGEADPETLPDDLVRTKREADKAAIKAALETGREVEGYTLSNGSPSLSIRVR